MRKKRKLVGRKLLSFLITLAMIVGLMPGMSLNAYADDPYASFKNTTTVITFDNKEWYLIDYDSSTATLLSKEVIGASAYYDSSEYYVEYNSSTIKKAVDKYYTDKISESAKSAVSGGMFLLTYNQAKTIYDANPDVLMCAMVEGYSVNQNTWWLCSKDTSSNYVLYVGVGTNDAYPNTYGHMANQVKGVRPALKVNLSEVVFDIPNKTFLPKSSFVSVTGVTISPATEQTTYVYGGFSFTASIQPDNATDKTVKWSVNNSNVKLYTDATCSTAVGTDATEALTVYAMGESAGSATVTVTTNDCSKTASCNVIVNETPPEHTHFWYYGYEDSSVYANCGSVYGCPDGYTGPNGRITLTISAPSDLKCDGNAKEATISGNYPNPAPIGLAAEPTDISYARVDGSISTPIDSAPTEEGDYTASFTWGDATASVSFTIGGGTDTSVTFGKVTDVSQIAVNNIGKCTFAKAKAWVLENWDDVYEGVAENITVIFVYTVGEGQRYILITSEDTKDSWDANYTSERYGYIEPIIEWFNSGDNIVYLCDFGRTPPTHTHDFT